MNLNMFGKVQAVMLVTTSEWRVYEANEPRLS
jgi:hypothetical protein